MKIEKRLGDFLHRPLWCESCMLYSCIQLHYTVLLYNFTIQFTIQFYHSVLPYSLPYSYHTVTIQLPYSLPYSFTIQFYHTHNSSPPLPLGGKNCIVELYNAAVCSCITYSSHTIEKDVKNHATSFLLSLFF